ncbi:MAG TPA: hypothetical protein VMC07_01705 [Candidatus Omnitrophota bacterium]|nr:hypothetical protein [Candidatus Omnitrophota bacterium]
MKQQKRLLASFLVIASVLFLAGLASAAPNVTSVKISDVDASAASVLAGDTVPIVVTFTSSTNESDVRLRATFEGKTDVEKEIFVGDVETGHTYTESLTLDVPYDLQDQVSNGLNLVIKIWNSDSSTGDVTYNLNVQRQSYDANVMSLTNVDNANAGQNIPVDIVVKNVGYNELHDLYAKLSVPALNLQKTVYFGDVFALENSDKDQSDTATGRVFLQIPADAKSGAYALQIELGNSDFVKTITDSLTVTNNIESNVIAGTSAITAGVGESVTYDLQIVNPTNSILVYNIVPQTTSGLKTSVDSMVAVPAGSSKTVSLNAKAESAGDYDFNVSVFSNGQLTGQTSLTLSASQASGSPIVVLTIVLAALFLGLLAWLIVLVTKKPKKHEAFEESYY